MIRWPLTIVLALLLTSNFWFSHSIVRAANTNNGGAINPTIGISPAKVVESVTPGKDNEFNIHLRNYGVDPLPLSASVTGIESIDDSGIPTFTDKISPRSSQGWITVEQPDVIINGGDEAIVKVKVSPPKDAAPGGYPAAVIFQAKLPSYYFDLDSDTRVLPAISSLFFLTVNGDKIPTVDDLQINSVDVPKFVVSSPISVIAKINNPSNYFIQADAKTTITGGIGGKSKEEAAGRVIILPTTLRKFVSAFDGNFLPGIYTASVQLQQGDKVFVASARFFSFPWQFMLTVIVIVLIFFVLAFRRRFAHALLVLIGKEQYPAHKPTSTLKKRPTLR